MTGERCLRSLLVFHRLIAIFLGFLSTGLLASTELERQILSAHDQNTADIVALIKSLSKPQIENLSDEALIKASYLTATSLELPITLTITEALLKRSSASNNPRLAGKAYYNRGAVYAYSGRHDLALDAFLLSLSSFEGAGNNKDLAQIKGGLALMYIELGEYKLAEPYFDEALEFYFATNDEENISKTLQNKGFMLIQLGDFEEAKKNLIRALEISKRLNLTNNFPILYKNLGKIEIELANYDEAEAYLELALASSEEPHLKHTQSESYRELSRMALKQNEVERAKTYINQSLDVGTQFNLLKQLKFSLLVLSEIEAALGNYKQAYQAKLKAEEFSGEMGESRIAQNLARLDRYTTELKEQSEKLLLEKENKIALLAAEREQLLKNFSIAIAIIAVLLAAYFIRRFSHSNKQAVMFEQQSKIDALTGIWNRRAGEAKLARLCNRNSDGVKVFSIAMLDIDHFKQVNDRFGHDVGDKVIVTICKLIEESLRPTDMLCRWGGEEFVIILEDFDSQKANEICDRIRRAIADKFIEPIGHLTVSIGISMFENDELFELLKRGDQALYHAKHLGRNRVVVKRKPQTKDNPQKDLALS